MELASIEQLLEKYENAETTLQEEAILKDYFSQEDIADHLYDYKALFNYFDKSGNERFTKTIPLKRKANFWWLSVAASILVVFSVYFYDSTSGSSISDQERKEAELAYLETQKAFNMISENLNKGNQVALKGLNQFDQAHSKVFK